MHFRKNEKNWERKCIQNGVSNWDRNKKSIDKEKCIQIKESDQDWNKKGFGTKGVLKGGKGFSFPFTFSPESLREDLQEKRLSKEHI